MDVCKQWYRDYKKKYDENIHLFNTDIGKCLKAITGCQVSSAVWRYMKIHGAIQRMGGFANFSHYVNKCADEDYETFEKLEKENEQLKLKAARWDALFNSYRIRILGTAGLDSPKPTTRWHFGMEIWSTLNEKFTNDNKHGQKVLIKYTDKIINNKEV